MTEFTENQKFALVGFLGYNCGRTMVDRLEHFIHQVPLAYWHWSATAALDYLVWDEQGGVSLDTSGCGNYFTKADLLREVRDRVAHNF